ncbi:MAG: RsmB/NOP family class I SAM-dependent RNA methyltransferase [Coraliomargaritaceae bacterium]
MKSPYTAKPLPEKVINRLEQILFQILPPLEEAVYSGRPADLELSQWMRSRRELGSRDRRFLSQAVFRHFRWMGWTRIALKQDLPEAALLSALLEEPAESQWIQHLAQSITFPKPLAPLGAQSIAEKVDQVNQTFQSSLSETHLITPDAASVIDPEVLARSLSAFQHRPPTWIRSRIESNELLDALAAENIPAESTPQHPQAIAIPSGVHLQQRLNKGPGQFIVQDLTSQFVGQVCAPLAGQLWWDCCAGSGGKSLHLADLMKQQGGVLSSDPRESALIELKKRARTCGIRMIQSQVLDATKEKPGTHLYDGVLVDAPCSGWGTWARSPDARWRTSTKDVRQSARRQQAILKNVAQAVKPGGTLVYAVCTLTQPETDEQVAAFLETHSAFELDPFRHLITGELTSGMIQILPSQHDGMFIARFRKKNETVA